MKKETILIVEGEGKLGKGKDNEDRTDVLISGRRVKSRHSGVALIRPWHYPRHVLELIQESDWSLRHYHISTTREWLEQFLRGKFPGASLIRRLVEIILICSRSTVEVYARVKSHTLPLRWKVYKK